MTPRRSPSGPLILPAYIHARWSADEAVTSAQQDLIPNQIIRSQGITLDVETGVFTLPLLTADEAAAGVYYELFAEAFIANFATAPPGENTHGWVDSSNVLLPDSAQGHQVAVNSNINSGSSTAAFATLAPSEEMHVHLRTQSSSGLASISAAHSYVMIRKVRA